MNSKKITLKTNKKKNCIEYKVLIKLTTDQIIVVIRDTDYIFLKYLIEDTREKYLQAVRRKRFLNKAIQNTSGKTDAYRKLAKMERRYQIKTKFFNKKVRTVEDRIKQRIHNLVNNTKYDKEYVY